MLNHQAKTASTSRLELALAQHNRVYERVLRPLGVEFVSNCMKKRSKCLERDHHHDLTVVERKQEREERMNSVAQQTYEQIASLSTCIDIPARPTHEWFLQAGKTFKEQNPQSNKSMFYNALLYKLRQNPQILPGDRRIRYCALKLSRKNVKMTECVRNIQSLLDEFYSD